MWRDVERLKDMLDAAASIARYVEAKSAAELLEDLDHRDTTTAGSR